MASFALFFGWDRPIIGREQEAAEAFNSSLAYWGKQQAEGKIESFEPVLLELHGGDLNGFLIVRGERDKLLALKDTEDFKNLTLRTDHAVAGFGIVHALVGEGVAEGMQRWMKVIAK